MSRNNTKVADDGPMGRRVIWQGEGKRIVALGLEQDGEVTLMCSSDCDSSGARTIAIPASALASIAAALFAESLRRGVAGLAHALRRVADQMNNPAEETK